MVRAKGRDPEDANDYPLPKKIKILPPLKDTESLEPVGGCLQRKWEMWKSLETDAWVTSVIRDGYKIPFSSPPPLVQKPLYFRTYSHNRVKSQALQEEILA